MKTPRSIPLRTVGTALAVSAVLALGACSSDDDDSSDVNTPAVDADSGDEVDDMEAGVTTVVSPLNTDQEVPAVAVAAPDATGEGTLEVDTETGAASGQVVVSGLTGPAQVAHIHRGVAGKAGPPIVELDGSADSTTWSVPAGFAFEPADLEAFQRGELYFNVHTSANAPGEIRGQIVPAGVTMFTVRLANVSDDTTLAVGDTGTTSAVPLSPGAFIIHREDNNPLITPQSDANAGLESVAEDGNPTPYVSGDTAIAGATVFDTAVGAEAPGPIGPGGAYEFTFGAVPGDRLGFVTMFVASNDWFYTPTDADNSIELFNDDGSPVTGDQSAQVAIWDSGTEVDELPGGDATTAPNQVRFQSAPNTGPDENIGVGSLASMGKSVELNGPVLEVTLTISP